jgi:hypothetical protein
MKGGFLENWSNSLSSGLSSLSNEAASLGDSIRKKFESMSSPSTPHYSAPSSNYLTPPPRSYGGKKRRSKKMRGGDFTDNSPTTGLAFHAAPFSGETARPNTWVGGKTKKRRRNSKRSKTQRKR